MTVELRNGDTLRLICDFKHKGKAYSGARIYAAIGSKGITFDELGGFNGTTVVTGIKDDPDWTTYRVTVDIPITKIDTFLGPSAGSKYEVYAKLTNLPGLGIITDIFWYGPEDDITLVAPLGKAEFQNLTVSYKLA